MPTYDFKCSHCGHRFEEFLPMTSNAEVKCPVCGQAAEKLISSGGGILFKGNGFYETDNRKPEYIEKAKRDKDK